MKFSTKTAIKFVSALSFVFLAPIAFGQDGENLVPNGSFEAIGKKPKTLGKIAEATDWNSPTGVRADLFIDTKSDEIGVPLNIRGSEDAKEGENYIGIVGFSYGDKMPRSYAMTRLVSPMKKGMRYCVKMYISLSESSKYASNNVGLIFSKKMFGTDSKVSIIEEVSVAHVENEYSVISARYNWTEVCGIFTADGGEKYVTIGNFASNEDTKYERMKPDKKTKDIKVPQIIAAYYYIDDVSVRLIDEEKGEKCDCAASTAGETYSTMIYQKVFAMTDKMTPKEKVEAHQVYFAFGKDKLSAEGIQSLGVIAEYLKANPTSKLQIIGHNNTYEDEVGTEKDYFMDMDNKRLASVINHLVELDIDESRIIPTRKGDQQPNDREASESDDDEMKQAKNRRVEFIIK